jgi:prepilin-type N-terminal cleavage/methylation domain-containing protein
MTFLQTPNHQNVRPSAKAPGVRARSFEGGFTLIELMVVVVIISILSVIAVPGIMSAMDDQKTFGYASSIADLGRAARIRAKATGRAQLLEFASNGPTQRGTVRVYEGGRVIPAGAGGVPGRIPAGGCTVAGQWTLRVEPGQAFPASGPYGEFVDAVNLNYAPDAVAESKLFNRAGGGATEVNVWALCFEPNGEVYARDSAALLQNTPLAEVLFDMEIRHMRNGAQTGPTRHVLFPQGAIPRVQSGL